MKIQITTEDFRNATRYSDPDSCPLAKAIERQVNVGNCLVNCCLGEAAIITNGHREDYRVTFDWSSHQKVYNDTPYEGNTIDEMIDLAKSNPDIEFPTIELELQLV